MTDKEKISSAMQAAIKQIEHTRVLMINAGNYQTECWALLKANTELKLIYDHHFSLQAMEKQQNDINDIPLGALSDKSNYK